MLKSFMFIYILIASFMRQYIYPDVLSNIEVPMKKDVMICLDAVFCNQ